MRPDRRWWIFILVMAMAVGRPVVAGGSSAGSGRRSAGRRGYSGSRPCAAPPLSGPDGDDVRPDPQKVSTAATDARRPSRRRPAARSAGAGRGTRRARGRVGIGETVRRGGTGTGAGAARRGAVRNEPPAGRRRSARAGHGRRCESGRQLGHPAGRTRAAGRQARRGRARFSRGRPETGRESGRGPAEARRGLLAGGPVRRGPHAGPGDLRAADRAGAHREAQAMLEFHLALGLNPLPIDRIQAALDRAIEKAPQDDRVWLGRGYLALRDGRLAEAQSWLDACRRRRPDDPVVWRARLEWAIAADRVDEAPRRCPTSAPTTSRRRASTNYGRGSPPAGVTPRRNARRSSRPWRPIPATSPPSNASPSSPPARAGARTPRGCAAARPSSIVAAPLSHAVSRG